MRPDTTRGKGRGSGGRRGGNSGRGGNYGRGNSARGNSANRVNMPSIPIPTVSPQQGGASSSDVPQQINQVQALAPTNAPPVQQSGHSGTATIRSEPTPPTLNQSGPIGEGTFSQSNTAGEGESSSSRTQRSLCFVTRTGLEPSGACAEAITKSFSVEIDLEGINWKNVSESTKNCYFEEFKKRFYWDPSIDTAVRTQWRKKAGRRYSDFVSRIKNAKPVRIQPTFISDEIWLKWLTLWQDPEAVRKSEIASQNRCASGNGVAVGTHTGGSITVGEHRKRYAINNGRDPTPSDLHLHIHTHDHDGKSFVGEKSRIVHERYEEIIQQQTETQAEVNQAQAYFEAAGGGKKRRVFGLGDEALSYYGPNLRVSSGSEASSSVPPPNGQSVTLENFQELLTQLRPVLTEIVKEIISSNQQQPSTVADCSSPAASNARVPNANDVDDDHHLGSHSDQNPSAQ